jgi:hypothetical protein
VSNEELHVGIAPTPESTLFISVPFLFYLHVHLSRIAKSRRLIMEICIHKMVKLSLELTLEIADHTIQPFAKNAKIA